MVGRERELEELNRELRTAIEGKGRVIFISAEAGIGKTRLVTEFLKSIKQKNIVKLSGWCLQNAEIPYFPFIEAFSNYYSTVKEKDTKEETKLNSWLKGDPAKAELSGQLKYLNPQALKDQTFASVAETVHSISAKNPVIFVVEDIHWADSASLALLHYIARAVHDSEKVLVLATFRSEELTNDSEGYPHRLAETLVAMRREDLFRTIDLHNLTPSSITQIAESMLGGRLQRSLSEKLAVESEGNPLFAVESLRMLHEHNNLVQENDEWRLRTEKLGVPLKIRDILIQRLACLNNAQKRLLDAASVMGDYFEAGLLSAIVEQDSLEVLETLNVIAHSTSMILADESCFRFDHARSREIIYESLSQPLKQGYHKKIAETLESTKGKNLPFSELAHHYAQAGNNEKAVKYALKAGHDALLKWSNLEAIKHFNYVLQNTPDNEAPEKRIALEGLGDAYAASSFFRKAIAAFDTLATLSEGVTKLRAIRKATDAAYAEGEMPDLLVDYAKKATELGIDDRLEMARIIANRGRAWGWSGRGSIQNDLADYEAALRVFEEENSVADVAVALCRLSSLCYFFDNQKDKYIGQLLRSVAIFEEIGDKKTEVETRIWLERAFDFFGLYEEHRRELVKVLENGEQLGIFSDLVVESYRLSMYYADDGKFEDALALAFKGLEYSKKTDAAWTLAVSHAALVHLFCLIGDMKQADIYFSVLNNLPEAPSIPYIYNIVPLARAVYFATKGCWKESNQYFDELLKRPRPSPFVMVRLGLIWWLEKQGRFEEAKRQREERQKLILEAKERFGQANVQLSVMLPRKVSVGEEFEIRVDLVNIGRKPSEEVKVEGLITPDLKVNQLSSSCSVDNESIKTFKIGPFKVETLKIKASFSRAGVFKLEPSVSYTDDLEVTKMKKANIISITAQLNPRPAEIANHLVKLQFDSIAAEKAFRYLVDALKLDYSSKIPLEKSGWRTMMQVMKGAKISKHSLYGQSGHGGDALANLVSLGLIESKRFSGERGRGGHALKLRINQEQINKNSVY